MTRKEYLDEHGLDDRMEAFESDMEICIGYCEACGGEFTNYDEGYYGTDDIIRHGKVVGQKDIYVHDDCLIDYLNLNTTHDQVAEFLRLVRIGG